MNAEKHIRPNSPISFSKKPVFRKNGEGMPSVRRMIPLEKRGYSISGMLSFSLPLLLSLVLLLSGENGQEWMYKYPVLIFLMAIPCVVAFSLGINDLLNRKEKKQYAILGILLSVGILIHHISLIIYGLLYIIAIHNIRFLWKLFVLSFRFGG